MYNVSRNNFYDDPKNSTVFTPPGVSQFIFDIVADKIDKSRPVFDPCVGEGSLLHPFDDAGFHTIGLDIYDHGYKNTILHNFLTFDAKQMAVPSLVIANPPFNIDLRTKAIISEQYGGRPLLPEVWLQKTISLLGKDIPIILFAPYGLRLNQFLCSKRWQKFINGDYPRISSIIALPKDVYRDVLFHSEILIFNIPDLDAHYFYHQKL
ncbi:MAG: SAM-dependent methyltransferase [Candidatus Puniceispirillales bacterium]